MATMSDQPSGSGAGLNTPVILKNSQRTVNKATFVPTRLADIEPRPLARPLETLAFLRGLAPTEDELSILRAGGAAIAPEVIDLARAVATDRRSGATRRLAPRAATAPVDGLLALGRDLVDLRSAAAGDAGVAGEAHGRMAAAVLAAFDAAMRAPNEPVGRLHLERLEMTPAGVEHGELVHSVPLTPKETVNISHREWSVTTKTFESIVQDSFEGYSETGVTDKTDLAQATENETTHSSALDVNGSVSATYSGVAYSVTAAASVSSSMKDDSHTTNKASIAHSRAVTKHASARTRTEHKTSFKVSSVAGTEDLAVRTLTNTTDHAVRVDYFQLMRKWQVDLVRYGLRLTYDLVVPAPGLDLIGPVLELQQITQMLTTAAFSFPLVPGDIEAYDAAKPNYYVSLAAQYGVAVDPPPAQTIVNEFHKEYVIDNSHETNQFIESVEFEVDPNYALDAKKTTFDLRIVSGFKNRETHFELIGYQDIGRNGAGGTIELSWLQGRSGQMSVEYWYSGLEVFRWHLTVTAQLTDSALTAWKVKTWAALRDAASAAFDRRLTTAKDRQAYLNDQLAQFDALTLRRMEHEEIMKWTLQWLLGPNFRLMPQSIAGLAADATPTGIAGDPVMVDGQKLVIKEFDPTTDPEIKPGPPPIYAIPQDGEVVKFLQDAIEWENALFFVYPYFWDHVANWPFKRFLVHPDPVHREFLRGGAARIVLTVRPDWETAFTRFAIKGQYDAPDFDVLDHPYMTIAQEIQNQAYTNYQNIPPANPDREARPLLYPEQRKAWSNMQAIMLAVEYFYDKRGHYPVGTSLGMLVPLLETDKGTIPTAGGGVPNRAANILEGLLTVPGAATGNFTDPWGNPYHYTSPGTYGDYDLVSYGKNGKPGGGPDPLDAPITSWAEGSTVARWYEYTPTSALDVSVDATLGIGGTLAG